MPITGYSDAFAIDKTEFDSVSLTYQCCRVGENTDPSYTVHMSVQSGPEVHGHFAS